MMNKSRLTQEQSFKLYSFLKDNEQDIAEKGLDMPSLLTFCSSALGFEISMLSLKRGMEVVNYKYNSPGITKESKNDRIERKLDEIIEEVSEIKRILSTR